MRMKYCDTTPRDTDQEATHGRSLEELMFISPNPIQRIILAISGPLSGTTSRKTATFI